jgi:hypothetical protein
VIELLPTETNRDFGRKRWAMKATRAKSLLRNWGLLLCVPILNCTRNHAKKTRPISQLG